MIIRKVVSFTGNQPDDDRLYSLWPKILDINSFGNMIGNNRVITTIDMQQTIGIIQAIVIGLHRRPGFAIAEKMICSDEILRTVIFKNQHSWIK